GGGAAPRPQARRQLLALRLQVGRRPVPGARADGGGGRSRRAHRAHRVRAPAPGDGAGALRRERAGRERAFRGMNAAMTFWRRLGAGAARLSSHLSFRPSFLTATRGEPNFVALAITGAVFLLPFAINNFAQGRP